MKFSCQNKFLKVSFSPGPREIKILVIVFESIFFLISTRQSFNELILKIRDIKAREGEKEREKETFNLLQIIFWDNLWLEIIIIPNKEISSCFRGLETEPHQLSEQNRRQSRLFMVEVSRKHCWCDKQTSETCLSEAKFDTIANEAHKLCDLKMKPSI